MGGDDVTVSWNDFESSSLDIIRNLWKDGDFSDVTLATDDGKVFRAHRVVLSLASSMLRNVLQKHDKCDGSFFLHMPDIDSGHLAGLLEFIYRGRCQVEQEMFEEFLNCGKALGIEHLVGYLQNSNTEDNNYDITQQQQTPTNTFTELSEENNENESKKAP